MIIHQKDQIIYLTFNTFNQKEIRHGIFTRHGGCSPVPWNTLNLSTTVGDSRENVIENRNRILSTLELGLDSYFDVWQVHSSEIVITDGPRSRDQSYIKADAIITNEKGISLLMRFADCVPILLYDPIKKGIGIIHAGWIGSLNKLAQKTVEKMVLTFHSDPKEIIAGIGPSISVDHYVVGDDVIIKIKNAFPSSWNTLLIERNGCLYLDLCKTNVLILETAGVSQIEISEVCTACDIENWFSHRAENGKTGRFGAIISLI